MKYTEAFRRLAYSHALEDIFQRSGFTQQRLFDGTPYLHYQRAGVPPTRCLLTSKEKLYFNLKENAISLAA